ncbi:MAG: 23S rRNA (adenine(2503)-C(2))-methyltransferase RlmN [Deltaproteobacteria bacterium]|nr:23S rRNA (adenine(2503)-C(2))-methyltransferase RlmN [Deltaproteobacteria bacterium]
MTELENIKDYPLKGLEEWMAAHGEKPFRARQVFHWLYHQRADRWEDMTTLSKSLRDLLSRHFHLGLLERTSCRLSADGTRKYTLRVAGGHLIESVLMPSSDHYTLCVSTQAGCAMGCSFCHTATMGLSRHLSSGEIVQQVVEAYRDVEEGNFIRNLVFMGMGEPLHNYGHTVRAIETLSEDMGFGFSQRRITVSTSGLVTPMKWFIADGVKANLALSLHAVDDDTRGKLMKVGKRWKIADLMETLRGMPQDNRIRVTIEYLLLRGVNDSPQDARKLVKLLHGLKCKVNLIPFNAVPGSPYQSPDPEGVRAFQQVLLDRGFVATLRMPKGQDIEAACGQLAARQLMNTPLASAV